MTWQNKVLEIPDSNILLEQWGLSVEELENTTRKIMSDSWDVAEDSEDGGSNIAFDEWTGQENMKLIKELKHQAIADIYRYGSNYTVSYEENNTEYAKHESHLISIQTS